MIVNIYKDDILVRDEQIPRRTRIVIHSGFTGVIEIADGPDSGSDISIDRLRELMKENEKTSTKYTQPRL